MSLWLFLFYVCYIYQASSDCNGANARTQCHWQGNQGEKNLAFTNGDPNGNVAKGRMKAHCNGFNRRFVKYEFPVPDTTNYRVYCSPQSQVRIRKSWWDCDPEEKLRYVRGFEALARRDELDTPTVSARKAAYSHALGNGGGFSDYHGTPEFLPYHRGLIYRIETAIRELPAPAGQAADYFRDFTMPYFDHTHPDAWDIVRHAVSQMGDYNQPGDGPCLLTGPFAFVNPGDWHYQPTGVGEVLDDGHECLRRNSVVNHPWNSPLECWEDFDMDQVTYNNGICDDGGWCDTHADPHVMIGGTDGTLTDAEYSPEDPIFYLHHTFVDYLWAIWQTCRNYQTDLTANSYTGAPGSLTTVINYRQVQDASPVYDRENTVRDLIHLVGGDIDINGATDRRGVGQWDTVRYVKGQFWRRTYVAILQLIGGCHGDTNNWFDNGRRRRMTNDNRSIDDDISFFNVNDITNYDINNETLRRRLGKGDKKGKGIKGIDYDTKLDYKVRKKLFPSLKGTAIYKRKKGAKPRKNDCGSKRSESDVKQELEKASKSGFKKLLNKWSLEDCICRWGDEGCKVEYPKPSPCDKLPWDDAIGDIVATWDDIANLIPDKCVLEIRQQYWQYAVTTASKYALCIGCYDYNVCDRSAIKDQCKQAHKRVKPKPQEAFPLHTKHDKRVEHRFINDDNDYYHTDGYFKDVGNNYNPHHVVDNKYYPDPYIYYNNQLLTYISYFIFVALFCCVCFFINFCIGGVTGAVVGTGVYSYMNRKNSKSKNLYNELEDEQSEQI